MTAGTGYSMFPPRHTSFAIVSPLSSPLFFRFRRRGQITTLADCPRNGLDHFPRAESVLINHEIGILLIEHRALPVEIPECLSLFDADAARGQISEPPLNRGVGELQINDFSERLQSGHCLLAVYHRAARRNHRIFRLERREGLIFQRAKPVVPALGNQVL